MDFELQKPITEQSQKLTLTYLMKRSFSIMQMTNIELKEFLNSEIEKNPILEIKSESNFTNKNPLPLFSISYFPTLFEHLLMQAKQHFYEKNDLFIAENIIGNLDQKGYFSLELNDLAKDLQIDKNKILKILKIIKTFDPDGIAAKNLQERILMQLNEYTLEHKVIKNYFDDILKNHIKKIADELKIAPQEILHRLESSLKKINLDPTSGFSSKEPLIINPDVIIKNYEKKWIVEIEENLPFFEINNSYIEILENQKKRSSNKYTFDAKILMKNILMRRKTLQKICFYIIQKQKSFILGKGSLNQLTIKEVAKFLNHHPSTISRAILNKYVQCPLGLLPMNTFFSFSHKKKNTLKHFKEILKDILLEEDRKKPFSDEEITNRLKLKGFLLNRRTICKYRKKLDVGTFWQRKKNF
jgi:RNA polymerase sigma-54 factor